MVTTFLVDSKIDVGEKLIEALDRSGLSVTAAYWLYSSETDSWRLMVASDLVDAEGPKAVYGHIDEVLRKELSDGDISLREISAISSKESLTKALRSAFRTRVGIHGVRMTRNTVGDHYIEDAYVYRVA